MRRLLVAPLLMLPFVAACAGDDPSLLAGRELRVAIEEEYLPFHWADPETGKRTGADHDMILEICARLGCVPHFVVHEWQTMIQQVSEGRFDLAATGIAILADRARIVDYSDPYLRNARRILARRGEDRFSDAASLRNGDFTVAAQGATTNHASAVDLVGTDRVRAFAGTDEAVDALIDGTVDAVIINEIAGSGYIGRDHSDVVLIGENLAVDDLGIIFPRGSDLVKPFNEALSAMVSDGSLAAITDRYFSP